MGLLMAYPQGINFRETLAYATDGANEDFEGNGTTSLNLPTYPRTTAQGNSVGWESGGASVGPRNRNSGNDRRIVGLHLAGSGLVKVYRLDLPSSGNYNVRIAAGDATYAGNTKVELFDTTSSLGVLCSGSTGAANSFKDAADAIYTAANWPGSNALVGATFSTTICRFHSGDTGINAVLAHLYVEAAAGGGGGLSIPIAMYHFRNHLGA